jgi:hypothetical protein
MAMLALAARHISTVVPAFTDFTATTTAFDLLAWAATERI